MQDDTCVHAKLKHRADDGSEREEDVQAAYLIGADGAKGFFFKKRIDKHSRQLTFLGVTRKLLGLTFLGSSRDEHFIVCDIQLDVENFDRNVCVFLHSTKPTNLAFDSTGTSSVDMACALQFPDFPPFNIPSVA